MELVRTVARVTPLAALALAGMLGAARPPALLAADPPWHPPRCSPPQSDRTPDAPAGVPWFRLDPVLDSGGTLSGQRLALGVTGESARHLDLAPESFAAGPVHGRVLVVEDDGAVSRLSMLDVGRGCVLDVAREAAVVRSALVAEDGDTIFEHRVDRVTRADEGVWRRSMLDGSVRRVLVGLPASRAFGPTFTTELALGTDGRLAVASCGLTACRVRVLDPDAGDPVQVDGTGPMIGVSGDRLLAYGACTTMPCPIEAIDLRTGRRTTLLAGAGAAALGGEGRRILVVETADGSIETLDLDAGGTTRIAGPGLGLPLRSGSTATSDAEIADGAVLLAPGGRLRDPAAAHVIDPETDTVTPLAEVLP